MLLKLYKLFTILFSPLIDLYLLIRLARGKEDKKRFKERLGYSTIKRPEGQIIWFQCASVGESNSAIPVIEKIIQQYEGKVTILITTGTVISANILEKKLKDKKNIISQYTPVDKYFVIKRFLKFWKPVALITIESEIWPNIITMSHQYFNKVLIVNAKISEKSLKRWGIFKSFKEKIFDSIDICYPQSQENQNRLISLGIQNTIFLGNLKFDISKLKVNPDFLQSLQDPIQERKMVLFASTHTEEEKIILEIYNKMQKKYPDLIFVIALRHPNRSNEVFNLLSADNKNIKRKSKNEIIDSKTNFYLYDEIGEMGTLFELSDIVVMCGSLVDKIGGHTPVEPAKHKCAILTGPYIQNNNSLFFELEKNKACIICKDNNNLINHIAKEVQGLFENKEKIIKLQQNAYNICETFAHVADDVAKNIFNNLNS